MRRKLRHKIYYETNKKELLRKAHLYYLKYKKEFKEYQHLHKKNGNRACRKYYWKNKDKLNKYHIKYNQKLYKTNTIFKITHCLRGRIYQALKGNIKSLPSMFLIGCEIDYLLYHLQSQFKKGMNWDNYGLKGWVIDHKIPCSKFNLCNVNEQRKCFHYSNLQPLWAEENRVKGNNFIL